MGSTPSTPTPPPAPSSSPTPSSPLDQIIRARRRAIPTTPISGVDQTAQNPLSPSPVTVDPSSLRPSSSLPSAPTANPALERGEDQPASSTPHGSSHGFFDRLGDVLDDVTDIAGDLPSEIKDDIISPVSSTIINALDHFEREGVQPVGGRITRTGEAAGFRPGKWSFQKPSLHKLYEAWWGWDTAEARAYFQEQPGTTRFLTELAVMGGPGKASDLLKMGTTLVRTPTNIARFPAEFRAARVFRQTMISETLARSATEGISHFDAWRAVAIEKGLVNDGLIMPKLASMNELLSSGYSPDVWAKASEQLGKIPGLRQLIIGINPSAVNTDRLTRIAISYNRAMESAEMSKTIGIGSGLQIFGKPFKVKAMTVENVVVNEEALSAALTAKKLTTAQADLIRARGMGDVMEFPQYFNLTKDQHEWIISARLLIDQVKDEFISAGGSLHELEFDLLAGEHYFPRVIVSRHGIERLISAVKGKSIGGSVSFTDRSRIHEFFTQGIANNIEYLDDPEAVMETFIGAMYASRNDRLLSNMITKTFGRTPSQLLPSELSTRSVALSRLTSSWSRRLSFYAQKPLSRKPVFKEVHPDLEPFRQQLTKYASTIRDFSKDINRKDKRGRLLPIAKIARAEIRNLKDEIAAIHKEVSIESRTYTHARSAALSSIQQSREIKAGYFGFDFGEPAIPNGYVRLYRGGSRVEIDSPTKITKLDEYGRENIAGRSFTTDRAAAETMKKRADNGVLMYVDVPRDVAQESGGVLSRKLSSNKKILVNEQYDGISAEGWIAVGRMDARRFPSMSGHIFPADVVDTIEKILVTQGHSINRIGNEVAGIFRTIGATTDVNYPFLQGLLLLGRNPGKWVEATTLALSSLIKPSIRNQYLLSQMTKYPQMMEKYQTYVRTLSEPEMFQAARSGSLISSFSKTISEPLEQIPVVGKLLTLPGRVTGRTFMQFANSFDTYLDVARIEWFKALEPMATARGGYALNELGSLVRNGTGTTSSAGLGVARTQRDFEGAWLFFAPRYTRSIFATVFDAMHGGMRGEEARRALSNLAMAGAAMYYGVAKSLGQEPNFDPSSPGFLSIRSGDNYIGIGSGYRSLMKSIAFSLAAAEEDPAVFVNPRRLNENPLVNFIRSRSSPTTTLAWDLVTGRDYIGKLTTSSPDNFFRYAGSKLLPFTLDSYFNMNGGTADRAKAMTGEFIFGRSTPLKPTALRDESVANQTYMTVDGKHINDYASLSPAQRLEYDDAFPEFTDRVRQQRLERASSYAILDEANLQKQEYLKNAGIIYSRAGNDVYAGQRYRATRATILSTFRGRYEGLRTGQNLPELEPKTADQKILTGYFDQVVNPALKPDGSPDFDLQESLEINYRRSVLAQYGEAGLDALDRDLGASDDPIDAQFRADQRLLQPYWDHIDQLWTKDILDRLGLSVGSRFPSFAAFQHAFLRDFGASLTDQPIPPELSKRFTGSTLSAEQAGQVAREVFDGLTSDYTDFKTEWRNAYLKENPDQISRLLHWSYITDVPKDLEPYLE